MVSAGIEALNIFAGTAYCDVADLANHRQLDPKRFENLLMEQKTVVLPFEDPVTFAVNAAKPIIDALSDAEKNRIEMLITCSESGIDFGKSISSYVHHYLGLNRNCRMFEMKQACYAGTAGFHNALNFILGQTSPGAKALVIATDVSRFITADASDAVKAEWSYAEPSSGSGAAAFLVGENPKIFIPDIGASGYYGYEVLDTCRPAPDSEVGDADLSLLSYLDCCEKAFEEYQKRVADVNYRSSFEYLVFHTPFGGMVKGAHRMMMRKQARAKRDEVETDYNTRVAPGQIYCRRIGNIMAATVFLSLAGLLDSVDRDDPYRIGIFSYGSGCCSEFYSGIVPPGAHQHMRARSIDQQLNQRARLDMATYDRVLETGGLVAFGTRNAKLKPDELFPKPAALAADKGYLLLTEINEYHRKYQFGH